MTESFVQTRGIAPDAARVALDAQRQQQLFDLQSEACQRYPAGPSRRVRCVVTIEAWGHGDESLAEKVGAAFERIMNSDVMIKELRMDDGTVARMQHVMSIFENGKLVAEDVLE